MRTQSGRSHWAYEKYGKVGNKSLAYRSELGYNLYFFLVLLLVLFFVTVSGSHSFSTSGFEAAWVVDGGVPDCACATAASISSWLTCSPARIRAAISGVTAICLTPVSGEYENEIRHSRGCHYEV